MPRLAIFYLKFLSYKFRQLEAILRFLAWEPPQILLVEAWLALEEAIKDHHFHQLPDQVLKHNA